MIEYSQGEIPSVQCVWLLRSWKDSEHWTDWKVSKGR